jgi:hypothetical protein
VLGAQLAPGDWHSQNGSTLTLTHVDAETGALEGRFSTAVVQPGCHAAGQVQVIVGWYDNDSGAVTFSAHVPQKGCHAVIAWSGHYDEATGRISTQFMRTSANPASLSGVADFEK